VAGSRAVDAGIYTGWAKIVVAAVADAAVEMLVFHGVIAVVAVHNPRGGARLGSKCEIGIVRVIREIVEEAWLRLLVVVVVQLLGSLTLTGGEGAWQWSLALGIHRLG
jgi:hypothetical protein